MKEYLQGRMDAWERIDAIKRRLGLAGFFNEQEHRRYPKGHPKAGEFMPKPKEDKRSIPARKIFNINLSPVETDIDGHTFKLEFKNNGSSISVDFLTDDNYTSPTEMSAQTKMKAALWWRRSSVNALKMMPDGVPLDAGAYNGDGRGQDRIEFYKAMGFHTKGLLATGITRQGKILPVPAKELNAMRTPEIREIKGPGKPRRPYTQNQFEEDLDRLFTEFHSRESDRQRLTRSPVAQATESDINNALRSLSNRPLFSNR